MTLPLLPPKYSSQLENIFLFQLHKYVNHRDLGNEKIFQFVIKELKSLQSKGLFIKYKDKQLKIYFPLLSILGDNLALNKNLGYNSCNSNYPCRICTELKEEIKYSIGEKEKYLRSISDAKNDKNGIVDDCFFNEIPGYNRFLNCAFDPSHDLDEGVCRYVMGNILNTIIFLEKRITLDSLNSRISGLNYISDSNVIPSLTADNIKQKYLIVSCSEMFFLIEYLGLLIGDHIPINHKAWKLYLLLRKIMFIVYMESFNDEILNDLDNSIISHNMLYIKLYGHLTVKFHNLGHYVKFIKRMGPPKFYCTIRCEGRHRLFKSYANVMNSRLNPEYSLALKNQFPLAYRFFDSEGFVDRLILGKVIKNTKEFPCYYKFVHLISNNKMLENYELVTSVRVAGTLYKENYIISYKDININFAKIKFILVNKDSVYLLVFKLKIKKYEKHYGAFCVEETEETAILNHSCCLPSPTVINILKDGKKYVTTRVFTM